jgi:ComF family protein
MKPLAAPLRAVRSLAARALSRLLPGACAGCGATCEQVLCEGCADALHDGARRCTRCALPLSEASGKPPRGREWCSRCAASPPLLDATLCVAEYAEPVDAFVLALKFHGRLALAGCLAAALARRTLSSDLALPDVIAPVPLSSHRLAKRGYNQAWEIARPFARRVRRPAVARLLIRSRDTLAQSELPAAERLLNMRHAFEVARPEAVHARHVGIVDDVMTSGATLDAAAQTLKDAGAARVTAFVVLRTPRP